MISSLVQPHFVVAGSGVDEAISSMPGINRQSVDVLLSTIAKDMAMGITAHMLFPVVDSHDKDSTAGSRSCDIFSILILPSPDFTGRQSPWRPLFSHSIIFFICCSVAKPR